MNTGSPAERKMLEDIARSARALERIAATLDSLVESGVSVVLPADREAREATDAECWRRFTAAIRSGEDRVDDVLERAGLSES